MLSFSDTEIGHLLSQYGYWAVMAFVGVESIGIPVPGETILIAAAVFAGTTHDLDIALVIAAAAFGAVIGDNIGFWIGREFGYGLLLKYGSYIHIDHGKIKLGQYLFMKHGAKVVFFGRFIAVLRALAAALAGINQMSWRNFLIWNAAGGVVWATVVGGGAYVIGKKVDRYFGTFGIAILAVVAIATIVGYVILHRNQKRLQAEAEKAFPGPLHSHFPWHLHRRKGKGGPPHTL